MPQNAKGSANKATQSPILEWGAALIGLVVTLGLIGFIGWQALKAPEDSPPAIEIVAENVVQVRGGYVLEILAINRAPSTAAAVEIEGTLKGVAAEPVKSNMTLDFVPGHSQQRGGLFFTQDPRVGQLELRALGYQRP